MAAIRARDGVFASAVHFQQHQRINRGQHVHKVFVQIPGPRVAVRLIDHHQAAIRPTIANGRNRRCHFAGVMPVVVHQHGFAVLDLVVAIHLEATSHTGKVFQPVLNGLIAQAFIGGDRHYCRRIQYVVQPGNIELNRQRLFVVRTLDFKAGLHLVLADIDRPKITVGLKAIGQYRARQRWDDVAHYRVIPAQHRQSVERQVVNEFDKGALQLVEVAPIGVHVIRIDVGHHRHHGLQVQEGRITFVRFRHQVATGPQLSVAARTIDQAANDESRVLPAGRQHRCHQAGSGGFTVSAGHRNTVAIAHQFAEHLGASHDGYAPLAGADHLRVVRFHRAGVDHNVRIHHVLFAVADKHFCPHRLEATGGAGGFQIGAGNLIALIDQHLRNTTHTRTADADKVNASNAAHLRNFVILNGFIHD